jgi:hypothetical protein
MVRRCFLLSLWVFAILCAAGTVMADDWKPVDGADLTRKVPVVEKDADAEGIFWEMRVEDKWNGSVDQRTIRNYVRIKIFTDRGREDHSTIDLEYENGTGIEDIAARTIKPDGSILELKKQDVFARTIAKAGGLKIKVKSFALPGVEAGAIIEYRWREIKSDQGDYYVPFAIQRSIPYRLLKYSIKPLDVSGYIMRTQTFQGTVPPFVRDSDGFSTTTIQNVSSAREEPYMPPDQSVRLWMLVYYDEDKKLNPDKFWAQYGKQRYEKWKSNIKVNDDVRAAAAKITADAMTPEQKVQRLFEYCRTKIKNVENNSSGVTAEDRAKLKENKSPGDTLSHAAGTGYDIDMLFVALATAAGFDARPAALPSREKNFFSQDLANPFFLRTYDIAVRVGSEWRMFDPGSTYVPLGMLRWQEEGVTALVCDPKEPVFVTTPMSEPDKSLVKRLAHLHLDEEGTMEGDVVIEYRGHPAIIRKNDMDSESPAEREKDVIATVKTQLSTAEVTNIKIDNVADPDKPLVYSYHVRVPGYAQRTGKRLFLQPAFFQHGVAARFATNERKYPIYFHYPWSDDDDIAIDLPAGYELDHPDAPAPFDVGGITKYQVSIRITTDKKRLLYKRSFFFGAGGKVLFPAASYPTLKHIFDFVHENDEHTITLKQASAPAN